MSSVASRQTNFSSPTILGSRETHSKNFARWVLRYQRKRRTALFAAFSPLSPLQDVDYDQNKTQCSQIYIGFGDLDEGYLHGSRLSEILCNGSQAGTWAFPPAHKFQVLPDWFDNYASRGLCWLDPEHIFYFERFDRDQKRCRLCEADIRE